MSCDIHAFVEHRKKNPENQEYDGGWLTVFGSELSLSRNYDMFALLAGVRNLRRLKPIVEPRGIPKDLSWLPDMKAYLTISEKFSGEPGYTSLRKAEEWHRQTGQKIEMRNGKPWRVEYPDWHSHSWLTRKELKDVFAAYQKLINGSFQSEAFTADYRALLAAIDVYENLGFETRFVFWFDN